MGILGGLVVGLRLATMHLSPVFVFVCIPEKGIIKSQRVFDVLLATDRGHYIKYFPYMDSPQSIGEQLAVSPFVWCSC